MLRFNLILLLNPFVVEGITFITKEGKISFVNPGTYPVTPPPPPPPPPPDPPPVPVVKEN